jgi:hypothetical protein
MSLDLARATCLSPKSSFEQKFSHGGDAVSVMSYNIIFDDKMIIATKKCSFQ